MLDDIDDVDLRLEIIASAERVCANQSSPEAAKTVTAIQGAVFDTAVAIRDGKAWIEEDGIELLTSELGRPAVVTWYLACSSLIGPLRPEIMDDLDGCYDQFTWPVQIEAARESLFDIEERHGRREMTVHRLVHALHWHRAWSKDGPVGAVAQTMSESVLTRKSFNVSGECAKAQAVGLVLLASWRLRVTAL